MAAAEIGRTAGHGELLVRASLVMEGVVDSFWAETGRQLCEEAISVLPVGDSAEKVRLMAQLVINGAWRSFDGVEMRSAEVLAMAERVADRRALVEALRARQFALSGPAGAADRVGLADRLLALGDDESALWGRLWRFDAYAQLGRIDAAEAELPLIDQLADRLSVADGALARCPLPRHPRVRPGPARRGRPVWPAGRRAGAAGRQQGRGLPVPGVSAVRGHRGRRYQHDRRRCDHRA
ncbi:hypothetical protein [Fodinicola feengrottensis]|uniref:hypothetical protein n=1 Tax=Fodinicola feengrottensis TaxID=435914 RepID=UPI0013D8A77E|nr:hypothetical protein [Fodinicola feengrottensis]